MLGLGGNLNNELESKQELFGRESCEWRNLLHVELWGGKFKQWIGIVARTLQQRKLRMEKYYCMLGFGGGNLNNELESWQELLGREGCEWRNQLHVGLSGENLNNELESWQELFGRESCESRNTIACWALGEENLNNELESRQELFGRESCEWRNLLHVELWGEV